MNYFAHGRHYIEDPYFLAGTAIPDWLNVVDRKLRATARAARPWIDDDDLRVAALCRGIVQHHHDDRWFHQTRAFSELSWQFTVEVRQLLGPDDSFRPSFLGHILVELLLDAALIEEQPGQLEQKVEWQRQGRSRSRRVPELCLVRRLWRQVSEPAPCPAQPRFLPHPLMFPAGTG